MSKPLLQKLRNLLDSGELLQIVDEELSTTGVLAKVGYSNKGQYISIINTYLKDNDIDISHFTPNGRPLVPKIKKTCPVCKLEFRTDPRPSNEQVTCSRACSNTHFRSGEDNGNWDGGKGSYRFRALTHYGKVCQTCGFDNELALEVHHIDSNRENNVLSNLTVLCANCHTIKHKLGL
jgi:5-methylcytosine-specific restriction endonuclease McrA